MKTLIPFSPSQAQWSIQADARIEGTDLLLEYKVSGELVQIEWPVRVGASAAEIRKNDLWRHTCFEAFLQGDGPGYLEVNLSPSGEWNVYRFDRYREGMREEVLIGCPEFRFSSSTGSWRLAARIPLSLPQSGKLGLGLTAVIEDAQGTISYWALKHTGDQPDFHRVDSFVATLR